MFGNISHPAVKKQKSGKRLALVCLVLLLLSGCGGDDPPPADASDWTSTVLRLGLNRISPKYGVFTVIVM